MRSLGRTISHLAALNRSLASATASPPGAGSVSSRLVPLRDFGSNPGGLKAWSYRPGDLPAGAPLVVVLHGCTQTAASYDHGAQWSDLARHHGFAVLFPEQVRANNSNLCFSWFEPADNRRDGGEPASIAQMIRSMIAQGGIAADRVFITGLSAGGAMTSIMLATYPDLFAAGAIIAGLPYGTASGLPEALARMRGSGGAKGAALAALVPTAPAGTAWPRVSVWHGSADHTVDVGNAADIIDQWRGLHRLAAQPDVSDRIDGHAHRGWRGADGTFALESFVITDMGHGTPLDSRSPTGGRPGAHMLDSGISASEHLIRMWGIAEQSAGSEHRSAVASAADPELEDARHPAALPAPARVTSARLTRMTAPSPPNSGVDVGEIINKALRAAGLIR